MLNDGGLGIFRLFTQFGFAGLITALFFFLLRWVLKTQSEILKTAKEEREQWRKTIIEERAKWEESMNMINKAMEKHTQGVDYLAQTNSEAHKFQKLEHERLIDTTKEISDTVKEAVHYLRKINGKWNSSEVRK